MLNQPTPILSRSVVFSFENESKTSTSPVQFVAIKKNGNKTKQFKPVGQSILFETNQDSEHKEQEEREEDKEKNKEEKEEEKKQNYKSQIQNKHVNINQKNNTIMVSKLYNKEKKIETIKNNKDKNDKKENKENKEDKEEKENKEDNEDKEHKVKSSNSRTKVGHFTDHYNPHFGTAYWTADDDEPDHDERAEEMQNNIIGMQSPNVSPILTDNENKKEHRFPENNENENSQYVPLSVAKKDQWLIEIQKEELGLRFDIEKKQQPMWKPTTEIISSAANKTTNKKQLPSHMQRDNMTVLYPYHILNLFCFLLFSFVFFCFFKSY
jgi:hypothetical protein